jgi:hypothetical protein
MAEIYKNTTLTVGHLINKIETGELGLPELQRPSFGRIRRFVTCSIP